MIIGSRAALIAVVGALIAAAAPAAVIAPAGNPPPAAGAPSPAPAAAAPALGQAGPARVGAATATGWLTGQKPLFEILQSLATTIALILGGIWAYFKVVKGRLYRARLEASIEGRIVSGEGFQCAVFKVSVKNVSLSRVVIDRARSTIEVQAYPIRNYLPEFHNAILVQLGVVEAIRGHDWVEPGECVTEDRLLALPAGKILALVIQLRLLETAPRFRLGRGAVVWNSVAVVLPQEKQDNPPGPTAVTAG